MVAMLAMLIGCIGVVQSIQSWLRTQKATIATYRCLGLTRRNILDYIRWWFHFIVLVGACIGVALSYLGLQGLFRYFSLPTHRCGTQDILAGRVGRYCNGLGVCFAFHSISSS